MSISITLDQPGSTFSIATSAKDQPAREILPVAQAFKKSGLSTPSYVHDHGAFHRNGRILNDVQQRTGAKILLAQKAFACFNLYPTLRNYLSGTAANRNQPGAQSPFGLWGALGTRGASEVISGF